MNASQKRIEIIVSATGESTVQTLGFSGNTCRSASQFLEAALGRKSAEKLTPEFNKCGIEQQQNLKQEG